MQLVKALAAPIHTRSRVQVVRVQSPEQTSSTLASIPPGWEQLVCSWVTATEDREVKECGRVVTRGLCISTHALLHVIP